MKNKVYSDSVSTLVGKGAAPRGSADAFSLVEVTIALGITSFAVVVVLGLLPVGLSSMVASKREFTISQIRQEMAADMAIRPFTAGATTYPTLWFDYDGLPTNEAGAYYTVTVAASGEAPVFPGSTGSTTLRSSLKSVDVDVQERYSPAAAPRTTHLSVQHLNAGR